MYEVHYYAGTGYGWAFVETVISLPLSKKCNDFLDCLNNIPLLEKDLYHSDILVLKLQ